MTKRKVKNEAYFTSDALARRCVEAVDRVVSLDSFDGIVEPSAGGGAFLRALPSCSSVAALDIEPADAAVKKQDFFEYEPPSLWRNILVVGNPPFGQRGALAIRFLNQAMEFASVVAFILPRSFRKHTFLNRVDLRFHLIDQFDCSDFTLPDGQSVQVKCVFQIWKRDAVSRSRVELPDTHVDFEMKHFHMSRTTDEERQRAVSYFDFAIAQVGSNFQPKNLPDVKSGSHWFVKAKRPEVKEVFKRMDFGFLDGQNTAHKSLSKRDIVKAYAEALLRNEDFVWTSISRDVPP